MHLHASFWVGKEYVHWGKAQTDNQSCSYPIQSYFILVEIPPKFWKWALHQPWFYLFLFLSVSYQEYEGKCLKGPHPGKYSNNENFPHSVRTWRNSPVLKQTIIRTLSLLLFFLYLFYLKPPCRSPNLVLLLETCFSLLDARFPFDSCPENA